MCRPKEDLNNIWIEERQRGIEKTVNIYSYLVKAIIVSLKPSLSISPQFSISALLNGRLDIRQFRWNDSLNTVSSPTLMRGWWIWQLIKYEPVEIRIYLDIKDSLSTSISFIQYHSSISFINIILFNEVVTTLMKTKDLDIYAINHSPVFTCILHF